MKKLKLRYKVLLSILIPTTIFFIFITYYMYREYKVYSKMKDITKLIAVFKNIGNLYINLQSEKELMLIVYSTGDEAFLTTLSEAQLSTNNNIIEVEESIKENNTIEIEGNKPKAIFQRLINMLDSINEKRNIFSIKNYDPAKISQYYNQIENEIMQQLSFIVRDYTNLEITASLVAYLSLLQEQLNGGRERRGLYEVFYKNSFDIQQFEEILRYIGQQEAFHESFSQLASIDERQEYAGIMTMAPSMDVKEMRSIALKKAEKGNFGIDPHKWWASKTEEIQQIHEINEKLLNNIQKRSKSIVNEKFYEMILTIAFIVICSSLALTMTRWNINTVTKKMEEAAFNISSSGDEIYHSVIAVTTGATETANAVSETATTVEELKQTRKVAVEKTKNVTDVSNQALITLEKSQKSLDETVERMNKMKQGMEIISDSIIKLSEHIQAIRNIIETVDSLSEQSHLLAVNAAIEASKAGEQGKGFSVVAQEVKTLAEQSKKATIQVRKILNDIQNATGDAVIATETGTQAVKSGVTQSVDVGKSIEAIFGNITDVVQSAMNIGITSQQQLTSVEQINIAMNSIKDASNQQVRNMEHIKQSIEDLNGVTVKLIDLIQSYKF